MNFLRQITFSSEKNIEENLKPGIEKRYQLLLWLNSINGSALPLPY